MTEAEKEKELWDVYDAEGNFLYTGHPRGTPMKEGEYHKIINVWIKNREGKYLISRRAEWKESFPGYYECVEGSAQAGEDMITTAVRETREEVGIDLDPGKGKLAYKKTVGTLNGRRLNYLLEAWIFDTESEPDRKAATTSDEVTETRWTDGKEINRLLDADKMVPILTYFREFVEGK